MSASILRFGYPGTDPKRRGGALAFAVLLWLLYFGSLKLFRLGVTYIVCGNYSDELTGALYFLPVLLGHFFSSLLAWYVLKHSYQMSIKDLFRSDWRRARSWLKKGIVPRRSFESVCLYLAFGLWLWVVSAGLAAAFHGPASKFHAAADSTIGSKLMVAALATLSAPVIEELFYRGFLFTQLKRSAGTAVAVALVSLLFAAHHMDQYRTDEGGIIWPSVCIVGLHGLILTLLRWRSNALTPGIIVHATINGMNTIFYGLLIKSII